MQPPGHKGPQKSVHYQGFGWAKDSGSKKSNNASPLPTAAAVSTSISSPKKSPQKSPKKQGNSNPASPHNRPISASIAPNNQNQIQNQRSSPYPQSYTPNSNNPMLAANNSSPFPSNNFAGMNRPSGGPGGSMMNMNLQQQSMRQLAHTQSMRNSLPPHSQTGVMPGPGSQQRMPPMNQMQQHQMAMNQMNRAPNGSMMNMNAQSMRGSNMNLNLAARNSNNNNNSNKSLNSSRSSNSNSPAGDADDDIYGNYSQKQRNSSNNPNTMQMNNHRPMMSGGPQPQPQPGQQLQPGSPGVVKPPASPTQPGQPGAPGNIQIANMRNVAPSQLSPQQQQQFNAVTQQNMMRQRMMAAQQQQQAGGGQFNAVTQQNMMRQRMMAQQQQQAGGGQGPQQQVKRNYPQGAWGPNHPMYRQMYQQRMMMAQQQQRNNPHYQQWMQYYQRLMQNPQGQLQQMIMQQQTMIANLKRQLGERDKHYHKTIQTTINFKDLEINDLRQQITKLDEENEKIGQLQTDNFRMKQELNGLRGDHQNGVFDNLLTQMNASKPNVSGGKMAWPGGVPPPPSGTSPAMAVGAIDEDPKARLDALLRAKEAPSEMLLTQKPSAADKKDDGKFAKYARMKKIGMPMVSIVNKMRMDGMSPQEIEEYTGEKVPGSEDKSEKTAAKGPAINIKDTKYDKYRKMQKLKMPMKTIINRMKLDGLTPAEMDAFQGKTPTDNKANAAAEKKKKQAEAMRQLAETMGLNPNSEALPSKVSKMKRIHWDIVELSQLRKTFWWDINKDTRYPQHIELGGKFELDFQVKQRKPRNMMGSQQLKIHGGLDSITVPKGRDRAGTKRRIAWIDGKRDQSIQIALKRICLPNEVIYDSIVDMDEEVLTLDVLEVIWEIVPNTDEQSLAESKVDEIGDDMEMVGVSERFHVEMSTIPEVKQQLSKWLFARTFREIYMDRLSQVDMMQKIAQAIRDSNALQTYFRVILSMGNLMNHGTLKGLAYGYKPESVVNLLSGIKDYSGSKDLCMFLYQFSYNQFPETRPIFEEFDIALKKAVRLEVSTIESNIIKMADEFTAIDLFMRRLHDDFHPGDTERFREYMSEFQEKQSSDMMNLKVKIQNATQICTKVAKYYCIELEDNKPEHLFKVIQRFVDMLATAKRTLLKLEKERRKEAARAAAQKERDQRRATRAAGMSVADRVSDKKKRAREEEEKGNLLFLDIQNAANAFAQRQESMQSKLEATLKEKRQLAQGKISASAQKDAIKRRVSAQVVEGGNGSSVGGLDMDEIKRLRALNLGPSSSNNAAAAPPMGNSLMVPGMEMQPVPENNAAEDDDDQKAMLSPFDAPPPNMENPMPDYGGVGMMAPMNMMPPTQEELEDMNQDIDMQQPPVQQSAPIQAEATSPSSFQWQGIQIQPKEAVAENSVQPEAAAPSDVKWQGIQIQPKATAESNLQPDETAPNNFKWQGIQPKEAAAPSNVKWEIQPKAAAASNVQWDDDDF
eukprot:CAMPEP_0202727810 /NCGR_PEP_ID=MMETSP1385-20130828/185307_1 /ASSEMBLY_ACC=CAM_ASM_000861 /TAXON_ID=933848 /ORGANISM="Elphidium margaritaceum" /LENGTH=1480 /DNA_ID=CAMNT_0049394053 /DNA_START=107 /DNA_END=4549 /DNA_ORIENTATION=-